MGFFLFLHHHKDQQGLLSLDRKKNVATLQISVSAHEYQHYKPLHLHTMKRENVQSRPQAKSDALSIISVSPNHCGADVIAEPANPGLVSLSSQGRVGAALWMLVSKRCSFSGSKKETHSNCLPTKRFRLLESRIDGEFKSGPREDLVLERIEDTVGGNPGGSLRESESGFSRVPQE